MIHTLVNQATPVFLIVDGHPVYRSAEVKAFVEATDGRLKDEQVWNQLKNYLIGKMFIKSLLRCT